MIASLPLWVAGEPASGVSIAVVLGLLSVHRPLEGGAAVALATARRPDGIPAIRLLAGVRPYADYAPPRFLCRTWPGQKITDKTPVNTGTG